MIATTAGETTDSLTDAETIEDEMIAGTIDTQIGEAMVDIQIADAMTTAGTPTVSASLARPNHQPPLHLPGKP